ncbi:MAG: TIGR04086 family membrane protein [Bacilli bacterium]|nr:TIGR04086 family membrane protein [Bacilli bacterium]
MTRLYQYLKTISYIIVTVLITTFLLTLFNYYDILTNNIVSYLKFLLVIIIVFIGGIKIGKKAQKKGWLEGLKLGLILTFLIFLFSYLGLKTNINLKSFIYYLIIISTTTLGGMFGISKKEG